MPFPREVQKGGVRHRLRSRGGTIPVSAKAIRKKFITEDRKIGLGRGELGVKDPREDETELHLAIFPSVDD